MARLPLCLLLSFLMLTPANSLCRFDVPDNTTDMHPFSKLAHVQNVVPPRPSEIRHVCYNESRAVCWCTETELDCSRNDGKLTFVPKVNGTFHFLNFTFNYLLEIGEDFFENVTEVRRLDIGDNKRLGYIHPQALKPLRNLSELYLDYDYALTKNYTLLEPVFSMSSLTRLDIRVCDLPPLPDNLFYRYPMPFLQTFYLHFNQHLQHLNMSALQPLTRLTTLGVASSRLISVHPGYAPSLEKLNLNYNNLNNFLHTCGKKAPGRKGRSYYPNLQQLMLKENKIKAISKTVCLPSLTYLDLGQNKIKIVATGMFKAQHFPNLQELYLENMELMKIEAGAFDNPRIRTVSLMYNHFYFSTHNVSTESFKNCTGIENLLLGQNYISNENFILIFGHLRNVSYIHLGNNAIKEISQETFSGFPNLTTLCLYQNGLTKLPDGAFDSLRKLTTLEINDNQIQTVQSNAFSPETRSRFKHVDLSQNPFRCDCDIQWLQSWMRSSPHEFNNSRGKYECRNIEKKKYPSSSEQENITPLQAISSSSSFSSSPSSSSSSSSSSSPSSSSSSPSNQTQNSILSFPLMLSSPASNSQRRSSLQSSSSSLNWKKASGAVASSDSSGPEIWGARSEWYREPQFVELVDFSIPQQSCMLDHETSVFIVIVVSILMATIGLVSTVYRYRWHIRLIVHEQFRGRGEGFRRRQLVENFNFDVYVAFADEDWTWVKYILMPQLEDRLGLRLYIRTRDASPGRYIADNIVENILTSRKILMVFSRSFARRKWCQFELSFGLHHVIKTDDELVVLRLHEIQTNELTTPMMAVCQICQILHYIHWSNESEARASFWGRLNVSLSEIIPAYR
ncbi:toll-like receptor 2 type-2 [Littorina saxatilis]|uniref:TIR domain-containing protein n=1 Tax=Littorina saxatilis TaxID=31220 RepID=A0AAN9AN50_9CAEN